VSVKCKVCGRSLKHPDSIAAGMGPTCRGSSNSSNSKKKRRSVNNLTGQAYAAHSPLALGSGDDLYLPISRDEWEAPDGSHVTHYDLGTRIELLRA